MRSGVIASLQSSHLLSFHPLSASKTSEISSESTLASTPSLSPSLGHSFLPFLFSFRRCSCSACSILTTQTPIVVTGVSLGLGKKRCFLQVGSRSEASPQATSTTGAARLAKAGSCPKIWNPDTSDVAHQNHSQELLFWHGNCGFVTLNPRLGDHIAGHLSQCLPFCQ